MPKPPVRDPGMPPGLAEGLASLVAQSASSPCAITRPRARQGQDKADLLPSHGRALPAPRGLFVLLWPGRRPWPSRTEIAGRSTPPLSPSAVEATPWGSRGRHRHIVALSSSSSASNLVKPGPVRPIPGSTEPGIGNLGLPPFLSSPLSRGRSQSSIALLLGSTDVDADDDDAGDETRPPLPLPAPAGCQNGGAPGPRDRLFGQRVPASSTQHIPTRKLAVGIRGQDRQPAPLQSHGPGSGRLCVRPIAWQKPMTAPAPASFPLPLDSQQRMPPQRPTPNAQRGATQEGRWSNPGSVFRHFPIPTLVRGKRLKRMKG